MLDSRAPEDQGFQPAVDVRNIGLRLPSNLNDNQIYPDMTRLPAVSEGWTEMSFFRIQAESCRRVRPIVDAPGMGPANSLLEIRESRKNIKGVDGRLQAMYGVSTRSEGLTGLPRIAMQHVSTASKKMLFVLQLQEQIIMQKQKQNRTQDKEASEALKRTFTLACDVLKSSHVLLKGDLASKFNWFFSMYTQWYALTYVLRCLCSSSSGLETDRAWILVEELFPGFHASPDEFEHGSIWRYLGMLRRQALLARQHAGLPTAVEASNIHYHRLQLLPDANTATAYGTATLSEPMDSSSDGGFSFSDFSIPGVMLLTDWDAVINGYLDDNDSYGMDFDMAQ